MPRNKPGPPSPVEGLIDVSRDPASYVPPIVVVRGLRIVVYSGLDAAHAGWGKFADGFNERSIGHYTTTTGGEEQWETYPEEDAFQPGFNFEREVMRCYLRRDQAWATYLKPRSDEVGDWKLDIKEAATTTKLRGEDGAYYTVGSRDGRRCLTSEQNRIPILSDLGRLFYLSIKVGPRECITPSLDQSDAVKAGVSTEYDAGSIILFITELPTAGGLTGPRLCHHSKR